MGSGRRAGVTWPQLGRRYRARAVQKRRRRTRWYRAARHESSCGRGVDIHCCLIGYPRAVTKRLIEVDDDKLAQVRAVLGTSTLKATVDAALDEVLALDQRRRALLAEHDGTDDLLADPTRRQAAWR